MPGLAEANGPSYISAHSADVILSDIRPFKLKTDALRSINVLLDEVLYNILNSAASLLTDRLRASLLSFLPTSLGKEALLEAEVELRAYWERTSHTGIIHSAEDDSATFYLPWAFELLRNKCEAYSTLNEADEDPTTEGRINEKFGRSGGPPPKAILVAPAALYLTAILEAICEHILSNVGRVAARDSSRTTATVNDLFTALCEDAAVYGYFRSMKVYDQIEQLSKSPKSRRSKSFSRNDRTSVSRTSSARQDSLFSHSLAGSVSRQSSDGSSLTGGAAASRSSFDKSRALRMFANGKSSIEKEDVQSGHKKSVSLLSDNSKHVPYSEVEAPYAEDAAMLQEFDDLMRSTSTMKMSLTPDRLKTMEVYKQEKDQRGNRRPKPLAFKPETDIHSSSRLPNQLPTLRHVDSIIEDDEENGSPKQSKALRTRQASVVTPPTASVVSAAPTRARSVSTSGAGIQSIIRKPVRTPSATIPSSFPAKISPLASNNSASSLNMAYNRDARSQPKGVDGSGMPARTRVKEKNRESLDLDDIMNGSDEEVTVPPGLQARAPTSPKRVHKVSSTTRELMDFLAEGPPDAPPVSKEGKQMRDFLAEGPPAYGASAVSLDSKPKAGRLQRMISKLNIGSVEKTKTGDSPQKATNHNRTGTYGQPMPQPGALSSLANRPIPPRPPRAPQPISPPPSPSQTSLTDENQAKPPLRKVPVPQEPTLTHDKPTPPNSLHFNSPPTPAPSSTAIQTKEIHINGTGAGKPENTSKEPPADTRSVISPRPTTHSTARKPVPAAAPAPLKAAPSISESDARDMQRLLASATTADECRLIVGMFLARSGIAATVPAANSSSEIEVPYPSPPPSKIKHAQANASDSSLENSLVEFLLGGSHTPPRPPRRLPRVPKPEPIRKAQPAPAQHQQQAHQQETPKPSVEKIIPLTTPNRKNTTEFPTNATMPAIST